MSRGLGSVQRFIVAELGDLPPGYGVLLPDWSHRRAAHGLERAGLVRLGRRRVDGRRRLVAVLSDFEHPEGVV